MEKDKISKLIFVLTSSEYATDNITKSFSLFTCFNKNKCQYLILTYDTIKITDGFLIIFTMLKFFS